MASLDQVEKDGIQTMAFCAYVMNQEKCDQATALRRMSEMCATVQTFIGLGNKEVNSTACSS